MGKNNFALPRLFLIKEKRKESHDVFSLTLCPENKRPFLFSPGQFNMLFSFGIGESAISISSSPHDSNSIIHTIRVVGSVTRNIETLNVNDKIAVRGPFGTPWPLEKLKGKSILLLAGGIGIAPLRSAIYSLIAERKHYSDITLIYGARSPDDLIYQEDLLAWQKDINVFVTVDNAPSSWTGHVGVITQLIPRALHSPANTAVMMCGPEIMLRFCYYTLRDEYVPSDNIYLSMERNMQCAIGQCGHCQWGPFFICKDGPVMNLKHIEPFFFKKEL